MRDRNQQFEMMGGTTALTPGLSPGRGSNVRSRLAKPGLPEIPNRDLCCPLSPGERAGVRASVNSNFGFC